MKKDSFSNRRPKAGGQGAKAGNNNKGMAMKPTGYRSKFKDEGTPPDSKSGNSANKSFGPRNSGEKPAWSPKKFEGGFGGNTNKFGGNKPKFSGRNEGNFGGPKSEGFQRKDSNFPRNTEKRAFGDKPAFNNRFGKNEGYTPKERGSFKPKTDRGYRPENEGGQEKPYKWQQDFPDQLGAADKKPRRGSKFTDDRPLYDARKKQNTKPFVPERTKPAFKKPAEEGGEEQALRPKRFEGPYQPNLNEDTGGKRKRSTEGYRVDGHHFDKNIRQRETIEEQQGTIRLNRYIANSGICSRRDADELIQSGQITVNGEVITEMGHQVKPTDAIKYGNKLLTREKMVYLLVNKPKDYITTTEDPRDRKTVMHLVENACKERIYPVGRLDRNTTGLLLLTNDGELASKLTHPSNNIEKVYQVEIDKPITEEHFQEILSGVTLEDGEIKADELAIITPDAMVIGIKIHSGRNHIVRRIFAHLGYEVLKLDRTVFAGLNKKDLPRGNYRFLTEKEVIKLKYFL